MEMHQPQQLIADAHQALALLKEGNARYRAGALCSKESYGADREALVSGQKPFAVVVCCADSRAVPEIFFDQKLGDLFVIRNAGNVCDNTVLGSIEYAVEHLGSRLVVVCGHSHCGAVTAAVEGGQLPPHIKGITDYMARSVSHCEGSVDKAVHLHIAEMVGIVQADSIVSQCKARVVGAYYDIHSGEVVWQ